MSLPFTNPYLGLPEEKLTRFQTWIDSDHHQFFRLIRTKNGTATTLVNLLVSKLYHELNRRGIVDITDTEAFEHFVANCNLTLPSDERLVTYTGTIDKLPLHGSTLGGVDQPTNAPTLNRGTSRKGKSNSKPKTKQPSVDGGV